MFNLIGEEVAELINESEAGGSYTLNFSASNLPTGIYIARSTSGDNHQLIKMNFLK